MTRCTLPLSLLQLLLCMSTSTAKNLYMVQAAAADTVVEASLRGSVQLVHEQQQQEEEKELTRHLQGSTTCASNQVAVTNEIPIVTSMSLKSGRVAVHYSMDPTKETVTIEMSYTGQAWLGFGFSDSTGTMVGSTAVMGLPDDSFSVKKYYLGGESVSGIVAVPASEQTLTNTSMFYNGTHTVMAFTKPMVETYSSYNEQDVYDTSPNTFIYAAGRSNTLEEHALEGSEQLTFPSPATQSVTSCVNSAPSNSGGTSGNSGGNSGNNSGGNSGSSGSNSSSSGNSGAPSCGSSQVAVTKDIPIVSSLSLKSNLINIHYSMNPTNETVTIEISYAGEAWLGFGFSDSTGTMIGSTAVMGLPGDGFSVQKYYLGDESVDGITLLSAREQTLTDTSMYYNGTHTVMTFTKPMVEAYSSHNEQDVYDTGANTFIYAVGASNTLAQHAMEGSSQITFPSPATKSVTTCVSSSSGSSGNAGSNTSHAGTNSSQSGSNSGSGSNSTKTNSTNSTSSSSQPLVCNGDQSFSNVLLLKRDGSLTLEQFVNEAAGTATFRLTYAGQGWISLGLTTTGRMIGSMAIIGLPGQANGPNNPAKYLMNGKDSAANMELLPSSQQTLQNASITQNATHTVLQFTKILQEDGTGEVQLKASGSNKFLYATGYSNTLNVHNSKGSFDVQLTACGAGVSSVVTAFNSNGGTVKTLWIMHGLLMALSWAILVPTAIGSSMLRHVCRLTPSKWFALHRGLNGLALVCILFSFMFAVIATQKQADGEKPDHFTGSRHEKFGLVIVLLTMAQALNGILRPHLPPATTPAKGEDTEEPSDPTTDHPPGKSSARKGWEIGHRVLGATVLGLAWYNCGTGLVQYQESYESKDYRGLFWIIVAVVTGFIVLGYFYQIIFLRNLKQKECDQQREVDHSK